MESSLARSSRKESHSPSEVWSHLAWGLMLDRCLKIPCYISGTPHPPLSSPNALSQVWSDHCPPQLVLRWPPLPPGLCRLLTGWNSPFRSGLFYISSFISSSQDLECAVGLEHCPPSFPLSPPQNSPANPSVFPPQVRAAFLPCPALLRWVPCKSPPQPRWHSGPLTLSPQSLT